MERFVGYQTDVRFKMLCISTYIIRSFCVTRQIAERTGIWPMLQTLWVCGEEQQKGGEAESGQPLQLTDDHRAMTLNALRVRPGDTIYFRAAVSTLPHRCYGTLPTNLSPVYLYRTFQSLDIYIAKHWPAYISATFPRNSPKRSIYLKTAILR